MLASSSTIKTFANLQTLHLDVGRLYGVPRRRIDFTRPGTHRFRGETTQQRKRGKGAALFGYTKLYGEVPGGQVELLRVPFGNTLPIKVPAGPLPVELPRWPRLRVLRFSRGHVPELWFAEPGRRPLLQRLRHSASG